MLAKTGPSQELELPQSGRLVLLDHLGAGNVRWHEVGRELDAVVGEVERIGQRVNHQRFGQAGYTDQQAMAPGEDRDEQLLEHGMLPDDDFTHLGLQEIESFLEALHGSQIVTLQRVGGIQIGVAHAETSVSGMLSSPCRDAG